MNLFVLLLMFFVGIALAVKLVKKVSTLTYFAFMFGYGSLMIFISSLFI